MSYPLPKNEAERLRVLRDLQVLDSLPQKIFDNVTSLAANICGTPTALISLVDEERVWFKARLGYEGNETRREESLCSYAIMEPEHVFVVSDASLDPRFASFPLVLSGQLRFYAGAPLTTSDGHVLGVVCVLDSQPRELTQSKMSQLQHLANLAMNLIEHESRQRRESRMVLDLVRKNERIIRSVLDEGPEMGSFIDPHHRYLFVNPAHEYYWRQPREHLLGMHVRDLVGEPLYLDVFKVGINQALSGREIRSELSHHFPGTGLRHMEVRHIPARDVEGLVFGVVERFRDVTELTKQALDLRKHVSELGSQRLAQRKYLHVISHDLKEPVNAINNAVPLLSTSLRDKLAPTEKRCLAYIADGGLRMAQLLEDLRLFSEMDTEGLQMASHPAEALLKRALNHLNDEMLRLQVPVEISAPDTLRVNAGVFELAVRYLIETMIRSSASTRPRLSMRLTHSSDHSLLQFVDHTERPASLPSVPAITSLGATGSTSAEPPLGLSIAEHIVKAHGGILCEAVTSEGSRCYSITLPYFDKN